MSILLLKSKNFEILSSVMKFLQIFKFAGNYFDPKILENADLGPKKRLYLREQIICGEYFIPVILESEYFISHHSSVSPIILFNINAISILYKYIKHTKLIIFMIETILI